ncbi:MAG: hypothetical protein IAE83_14460 [Anaerolinea sp.]|nr:hypothetical protein [Anaerolinea sp.]
MSRLRRLPVLFDLDDPGDAALWAAIEPYVKRRRGSQFIRDAIARVLGQIASGMDGSTKHGSFPFIPLSVSSGSSTNPGDDEEAASAFVESFS